MNLYSGQLLKIKQGFDKKYSYKVMTSVLDCEDFNSTFFVVIDVDFTHFFRNIDVMLLIETKIKQIIFSQTEIDSIFEDVTACTST